MDENLLRDAIGAENFKLCVLGLDTQDMEHNLVLRPQENFGQKFYARGWLKFYNSKSKQVRARSGSRLSDEAEERQRLIATGTPETTKVHS